MIFPLQESLDTWPCVNVMIRTTKNFEVCTACSKTPAVKLLQLYGQPYNQQTLRYKEPVPSDSDVKVSHRQVVVVIHSHVEKFVYGGLSYSNFEYKMVRPYC